MASQILVDDEPSSEVDGVTFSTEPSVIVEDVGNNPIEGDTVTVAIDGSDGTLLGVLTATTDVDGEADFPGLSIVGPVEDYDLSFTDGAAQSFTDSFSLTVGAASQIIVIAEPSSEVDGIAFSTQPEVIVEDVGNNPIDNSTVTVAIDGSDGSLGGPLTATTGVNGEADFTGLSITGPVEDYDLSFTDGAASNTTDSFSLTIGVASQIIVIAEPSSEVDGVTFSTEPSVIVEDVGNNPIEGDTVTVAIDGSDGSLGGPLTATTGVNGEADFTGLSITGPVEAYDLSLTDGAASNTTDDFSLTIGAASQLVFTTQPAGAQPGRRFLNAARGHGRRRRWQYGNERFVNSHVGHHEPDANVGGSGHAFWMQRHGDCGRGDLYRLHDRRGWRGVLP